MVSFTITALKEVEVTTALELLHGMYYSDFDNMLENVGELFIFTPGRSDYKPLEPSRKSFYFLLDKADFSDLQVKGFLYSVGQLTSSPNALGVIHRSHSGDWSIPWKIYGVGLLCPRGTPSFCENPRSSYCFICCTVCDVGHMLSCVPLASL